MSQFSLFRLLTEEATREIIALRQGRLAQDSSPHTLTFETTVPTLAAKCCEMEQTLLADAEQGGSIYAGFQHLSRFTPRVARRYLGLAAAGYDVSIFGLPDQERRPTHPRLHYVELHPGDPLSNEWFMLVDAPHRSAAICCLELFGADSDLAPMPRLFAGVLTYASPVAHRLTRSLTGLLHETAHPKSQEPFLPVPDAARPIVQNHLAG